MRKAIKTFAIILICSVPVSFVPYYLASFHVLCNISESLHAAEALLQPIALLGSFVLFVSYTVLVTLSIVFKKFKKAELINEKYPLALALIAFIIPVIAVIADTVYSVISAM